MPKSTKPLLGAKRELELSLEPIAGAVTLFYAFINGVKVIQDDGTQKQSWKGEISDAQVVIKVRVIGIGEAQYKLGIDLPGTANDQSITFNLHGGYHEAEITI